MALPFLRVVFALGGRGRRRGGDRNRARAKGVVGPIRDYQTYRNANPPQVIAFNELVATILEVGLDAFMGHWWAVYTRLVGRNPWFQPRWHRVRGGRITGTEEQADAFRVAQAKARNDARNAYRRYLREGIRRRTTKRTGNLLRSVRVRASFRGPEYIHMVENFPGTAFYTTGPRLKSGQYAYVVNNRPQINFIGYAQDLAQIHFHKGFTVTFAKLYN